VSPYNNGDSAVNGVQCAERKSITNKSHISYDTSVRGSPKTRQLATKEEKTIGLEVRAA